MNVEESRTLGRIEAKQDMILTKLDEHMSEDKGKFFDHERRVRSLEKSKYVNQGIAAGVATLISSAVAIFIKFGGGGTS